MGDEGRGVPKSTHDATETDHADQNESYHWTKQTYIEPEKDWSIASGDKTSSN